jgi:hypothetical protein
MLDVDVKVDVGCLLTVASSVILGQGERTPTGRIQRTPKHPVITTALPELGSQSQSPYTPPMQHAFLPPS